MAAICFSFDLHFSLHLQFICSTLVRVPFTYHMCIVQCVHPIYIRQKKKKIDGRRTRRVVGRVTGGGADRVRKREREKHQRFRLRLTRNGWATTNDQQPTADTHNTFNYIVVNCMRAFTHKYVRGDVHTRIVSYIRLCVLGELKAARDRKWRKKYNNNNKNTRQESKLKSSSRKRDNQHQ